MTRIARLSLVSSLCFGAAALALSPTEAQACGGTFCDGGQPTPMPVDQSGENILFVVDGDTVEAHIQIQYMGAPEKFGWVIPLTGVPEEIAPGSDPLFRNMLAASVPTYGFTNQNDVCQAPTNQGDGFGTAAGAGDDGGGSDGGDEGGPTILLMEEVGAFEVTVLTGGSADEVVAWLDENGYEQDPEATPILQEYLDEGHVFAAVKLIVGSGVDEIHPLMFRFKSSEPCIPLRLTRIAATEDMDVRTFFLGDGRIVPRNYRHVEVNPLLIDWPNQATNYKEVISLAVDSEHADGRAFVTEYAGANIVGTNGILNPAWNSASYEGIEAISLIGVLMSQGLFECGFPDFEFEGNLVCQGSHPLVQALLDQYLPVPAGVDPNEFYDNPDAFSELIDQEAWDAAGFAADLQARIIAPGEHAVELLAQNPYLTRMYTTISPSEMLEDPMFHQNRTLPEVQGLRMATNRSLCNGDNLWTLPDGREVYVPAGSPWPDFDAEMPEGESMPMTEFVDEVPAQGAPMRLVDNTEVIDARLADWNRSAGWNGADIPEGGDAQPQTAGCNCTSGGPLGAVWMFGLGFMFFVARRRN